MQKLIERLGAMAHGVFLRRIDFGKSFVHAIGDEDRIIAEAMISAWRKCEMAMHLAFKSLGFAAGQRDTQGADEFRGAGGQSFLSKFLVNASHGDAEILARSRPAGRMDSGR